MPNNPSQRRNTNLSPWEAHQRTVKGWVTKHQKHPNFGHFGAGVHPNFIEDDSGDQGSFSSEEERQYASEQHGNAADWEKESSPEELIAEHQRKSGQSRKKKSQAAGRASSEPAKPKAKRGTRKRQVTVASTVDESTGERENWYVRQHFPRPDQIKQYDFQSVPQRHRTPKMEYDESGHESKKGLAGIKAQREFINEQHSRRRKARLSGNYSKTFKIDWDKGTKLSRDMRPDRATLSIGPNKETVYPTTSTELLESYNPETDPTPYVKVSFRTPPTQRSQVITEHPFSPTAGATLTDTEEYSPGFGEIFDDVGLYNVKPQKIRSIKNKDGTVEHIYKIQSATLISPQKRRKLQRELEQQALITPGKNKFLYNGPLSKERQVVLPGEDNWTKIVDDPETGPRIGRHQLTGQVREQQIFSGPAGARLGLRDPKTGELLSNQEDIVGVKVPELSIRGRKVWGEHLAKMRLKDSTDAEANTNAMLTAIPRARKERELNAALAGLHTDEGSYTRYNPESPQLTAAIRRQIPTANEDEINSVRDRILQHEAAARAIQGDPRLLNAYIQQNYREGTKEEKQSARKEIIELGGAGGAAALYTGRKHLKLGAKRATNTATRSALENSRLIEKAKEHGIVDPQGNLLRDIDSAYIRPAGEWMQTKKYTIRHPMTDPETGIAGVDWSSWRYRDRGVPFVPGLQLKEQTKYARRFEQRRIRAEHIDRTILSVNKAIKKQPSAVNIPGRINRAATLRTAHTFGRNPEYVTAERKKLLRQQAGAIHRTVVMGVAPSEGDKNILRKALKLTDADINRLLQVARTKRGVGIRSEASKTSTKLWALSKTADTHAINPEELKPFERIGWGAGSIAKHSAIGLGILGGAYLGVRAYDAYQDHQHPGHQSFHDRMLPTKVSIPSVTLRAKTLSTVPHNAWTESMDVAGQKIQVPDVSVKSKTHYLRPSLRKDISGQTYPKNTPLVGGIRLRSPTSGGSWSDSLMWKQRYMGGHFVEPNAQTGNQQLYIKGKEMPVRVFVGEPKRWDQTSGRGTNKLRAANPAFKRQSKKVRLQKAAILSQSGNTTLMNEVYGDEPYYNELLQSKERMRAVTNNYPTMFMNKDEKRKAANYLQRTKITQAERRRDKLEEEASVRSRMTTTELRNQSEQRRRMRQAYAGQSGTSSES